MSSTRSPPRLNIHAKAFVLRSGALRKAGLKGIRTAGSDDVLTEKTGELILSNGRGLRPDDHPMSITILIDIGVPVVTEGNFVHAEDDFELSAIPKNRNSVIEPHGNVAW